MSEPFRVGLSPSFVSAGGPNLMAQEALSMLTQHGIEHQFLSIDGGVVTPDRVRGYDAIVLMGERVQSHSLDDLPRLIGIARWGVGYDAIDLEVCTAQDVCVFITPLGVRRPMAVAILTLLLALATHLRPKDRLVREGNWEQKTAYMGEMLPGKILGSLGLGGIATEMFRLAAPLGMRHVAHDPYRTADEAEAIGVRLVDKATLLREADFLCINCQLSPETRRTIGPAELGLMKPSAYLINTSRGPIVDEAALIDALRNGRLRGAGLDVFEQEPLPKDSPLIDLDNVVLAPHALGWTDELVLNLSTEDAAGLVRLAQGQVPAAVVNAAVIDRPGFQRKLQGRRG